MTDMYSDFNINLDTQTDGDIIKSSNFEAIINSVTNIINTLQGSRRMLPEFATDIQKLLFEPIDEITGQMIGERILQGIRSWDDRIELLKIYINPNYDNGQYDINLSVRVKTTKEVKQINFILK